MDTKSYLAGLGTLPALAATALAARVGFVQAVNRTDAIHVSPRKRSPWPLLGVVLRRRTMVTFALPGSDLAYYVGAQTDSPDEFEVLYLIAPPDFPMRRFGKSRLKKVPNEWGGSEYKVIAA